MRADGESVGKHWTRYVAELSKKADVAEDRKVLRRAVYEGCHEVDTKQSIYGCDSGVGTGKTTAIMAHALRVAEERELRHIFVVLPWTNVIDQSVRTYRSALVLDGEDSERVVAAHHHQVDFQSKELRQLATLWDCPVTVTTAVQFFGTLAARVHRNDFGSCMNWRGRPFFWMKLTRLYRLGFGHRPGYG